MLEKIYENDIVIKCKICGEDFVFTKKEQEFYKEKGFELPRRCWKCRKKKYIRKGN
jgi:hypothetical protein